MDAYTLKTIAASKDVALVLSLSFNAGLCGAIWLLWRSREALQEKVTSLLVELIQEMNRRYWRDREP